MKVVRCMLYVLVIVLCSALLVIVRILSLSNAPYIYLLMIFFVWGASFWVWTCWNKKEYNSRGLYVFNFVLLYAILVISSYMYGWFLDYKLNQFDIDGDSFFSVAEQTTEQQLYMQLHINDAGRNLMVYLGAVYSLFSTVVLFIIVKMYKFFSKYKL